MTVPVEIPYFTFVTDGATTAFAIPFSWTESADIQAQVAVAGQVVAAPFSVTGTTGNSQIVFNTAPAAGTGRAWRTTPIEQDQSTPFASGGAFPNEALAAGLDYLTRIVAELAFSMQSTLRGALGDAQAVLPGAAARVLSLIGFDGGGALTLYPLASAVVGKTQAIVVDTAGVQLVPNLTYALKTGVGNLAPVLPPLSSVQSGALIEIQDVDFAAFTNHQVIAAFGPDTIVYQDLAPATTFTMNENGVCLRFVANETYWRVIYYGG